MAVGVPTCKVEIEWSLGTWTDVTAYAADTHSGTFGRATEFDDISAGTWTLTLRNDDGRFTPDNPLSPYFPNVVENRRLRVTMTPPGGSPYVRFLGYITSLDPTFPDQGGYSGVVTVQAADLLAVMNRRQMQTGWLETGNYVARLFGSWNDSFSFVSADASGKTTTTFGNLGEVGGRTTTGTASIIAATSGAGSATNGTDDAISEPALSLAPAGIVGPVLKVVPGGAPQQVEFFVKIPTTGLAAGTTGLVVADFYNTAGTELFSLRVQKSGAGTVDFCIYNGSSTPTLDNYLSTLTAGSTNVDTDTWLKVTLYPSSGGTVININDSVTGTFFGSYDLTAVGRVYIGGYLGHAAQDGKQTYCPLMSVAGVDVQGTAHGVYYWYAYGTPPPTTATQRFIELAGYGSQLLPWRAVTDMFATAGSAVITSATANFTQDDVGKGITITGAYNAISSFIRPSLVGGGTTIISVQSPTQATMSNNATLTVLSPGVIGIIGPTILGADDRTVVRYNPQGQTLAEAMQLHARTIGGAMWVSNTGIPTLIYPDQMRSTTPIATVSIEDDCDAADFQLRRSVDQAPTRVTVTSPIGQAVIVDSVAEGLGYRREVTVDTGCATVADLGSVGNFYLKATKRLRITQITVDLSSGASNSYATLYGQLRPGSRVRITGLPTTTFGLSYVDVYVQGWTETYSASSAAITFDCSPADAPTEGTLDDAEYGRLAADGTLDLAAAISATDTTLAITRGVGATIATPVMTTSSADYPLDIDLNGERITLPAAPTSTTTRTNLCTNPSFGSNTTGWVAGGTVPTLATSTTYAYVGTSSLRVAWPTAALGASQVSYTATVTAGATYAFSVYVYVPTGAPAVQLKLTSGAGSVSYSGGQQFSTGTTNAWVRLGMQVTASGTSLGFGLVTNAASTSGQFLYVDSALLEQGFGAINSYFDGDVAGTWTGTAHASTSTQVIQTYTGVTRGGTPTVARAHLGGEDVDLWHAAALAL